MNNMKKPMLIGIAGGSGSGKSTVTNELVEMIDGDRVVVIAQDNYYKSQNSLPFEQRVFYIIPIVFSKRSVDFNKRCMNNSCVFFNTFTFKNRA